MTNLTPQEQDAERLTAELIGYYWLGIRIGTVNSAEARRKVRDGVAFVIDSETIGALDYAGGKADGYGDYDLNRAD